MKARLLNCSATAGQEINMTDWRIKFTSRKFWAAVADFVGMLLIALRVAEGTAAQVTALIMAGAGVVAYILGEGLIDAAREQDRTAAVGEKEDT